MRHLLMTSGFSGSRLYLEPLWPQARSSPWFHVRQKRRQRRKKKMCRWTSPFTGTKILQRAPSETGFLQAKSPMKDYRGTHIKKIRYQQDARATTCCHRKYFVHIALEEPYLMCQLMCQFIFLRFSRMHPIRPFNTTVLDFIGS